MIPESPPPTPSRADAEGHVAAGTEVASALLALREALEPLLVTGADVEADPAALAWVKVIRANYANGQALVAEARMLHTELASPRGLALAVLATEEFGKVVFGLIVLGSGGAAVAVNEFKALQLRHEPKVQAGQLWSRLAGDEVPALAALAAEALVTAQSTARRKLDALYVDRRPDGSVRCPDQDVTHREVAEAIDSAAELGAALAPIVNVLAIDVIVQAFWQRGPDIQTALAADVGEDHDRQNAVILAVRPLLSAIGLQAEPSAGPEHGAPAAADVEP